jgi:hypothetical protein
MLTARLRSRPPVLPLLVAALAAIAAAACSSASQTTPQVRIDAPVASSGAEEPSDNLLVTIAIAPHPPRFAVDGDLDEWGEWPEPVPAAGPSDSASPRPAKSPPRTPRHSAEPSSRVVLAMDEGGLALAGEMSPSHAKGFWITLVLDMPQVPSIGYWNMSGGVTPIYCDDESMGADDLAECKALIVAHESFESEHIGRFQADYFVSPAGITARRDGKLSPVFGAQVVFKPAARGFHVEATLPAKGLPRTQQAPLDNFRACARGGELARPPALPPEEWSTLSLPRPVGFEPYAALRALAFEAAMRRPPFKPFSMSYQPGDGLEVEDLHYESSTRLLASSETLYSKQIAKGDLEVGFVYTGKAERGVGWTSFVSIHKGTPLVVMDLTGPPLGVVQRGDEVHAFAYATAEADDGMTSWSSWGVVAFGPDGAPREDLVDEVPQMGLLVGPLPAHAPDFSTFSVAGTAWDFDSGSPGPTIEATWKWDPKKKRYTATVKDLSPGGKKPARPQKAAKAPKK